MKYLAFALITGFFVTGFLSCNKFPDLDDPERIKDLSITYYDTTAGFGSYATYAIVDTVGRIELDDDSLISTPSDYSDQILDLVNSKLSALGYTKVAVDQDPDLLINANVLEIEVTSIGYTGGYWDSWYWYDYNPYYGNYWGSPGYWGYPGYSYWYPYSYPYAYTSSFGTVLLEMLDRKNMDSSSEQMKVIWTAVVAGTTNYSSNISERITSGINECFDQSQYLGK